MSSMNVEEDDQNIPVKWEIDDLPWDKREVDVKDQMRQERLDSKVKLRKLFVDNKIFRSRNIKKKVDPFEKDQMFINECMKMKDKKDVDEYKRIFNEIWKGEMNNEKVKFYYDIISQYDFKIKKMVLPRVFDFNDIKYNVYCKTVGKTYFLSTDELYWVFKFWIFYYNWLESIKKKFSNAKDFNNFWLGEKKKDGYDGVCECFKDLVSVKIISSAFPLNYGYKFGYFQDYSSDYYYGDLMCLNIGKKEELKKILSDSEKEFFIYKSIKYCAFKIDLNAVGLSERYKDWNYPVFICKADEAEAERGFTLLNSMTGVYVEHVKDDINVMKAGLKNININKEKSYYFINSTFKPTYFCPSCISFSNPVDFGVMFEATIDYDRFMNQCVGRGFLCFPFASLRFNNLDSVFNLAMLFLFLVSIQNIVTPDKTYLSNIREMMRIYLRNRDVFRMVSDVYNKFRDIVLGYIDGLFGKFYYSKYVKIYKISNGLISEYKKAVSYFYVDSEVSSFVNFWGLSGLFMQNFIKGKIGDVISGINNACYQIVNYVSKDAALYLRTAGMLCYSVLYDGSNACLNDIRPHCLFLGGLEGDDEEDIFNRIAILINTKKHREDISRQTELFDMEKVDNLSKIVINRYKNDIEKIIEENKLNEGYKNFVYYVAMFLKDISDINNVVMEETNELMKDKKIFELEKDYGVVSNLKLNNIIREIILKIFNNLKVDDVPNDLLDEDSEISKSVYDAIYDDLRVLNAGNEADMASSGSIKRSLIEKLRKKIYEMDKNDLQKINKSKRIRYNFKKKKKNFSAAPNLIDDYMKKINK